MQTTKWEHQDGSVNRIVRDAKRSIVEKKKDEPVIKLSRRSINEPEHILKEHHGMVFGFPAIMAIEECSKFGSSPLLKNRKTTEH